jgi:hypothetical protein
LAQQVIDAGAGEVFVHFLEEFDTGIKEAGAWGLCYIVRHSAGKILNMMLIFQTSLNIY